MTTLFTFSLFSKYKLGIFYKIYLERKKKRDLAEFKYSLNFKNNFYVYMDAKLLHINVLCIRH